MDPKNNLTKGSRIYLAVLLLLFTAVAYSQYYDVVGPYEFIADVFVGFLKLFFGGLIISAFLAFPFKAKKIQVVMFNVVLTALFLVISYGAVQKKLELIDDLATFHTEINTFVTQAEEEASAPWIASFGDVQELFTNVPNLNAEMVLSYTEKADVYVDQTKKYTEYFNTAVDRVGEKVSGYYKVSQESRNDFLTGFTVEADSKKEAFNKLMALHLDRGKAIKVFLDFLSATQKDWTTDGKMISFQSDEQVARYQALIGKIAELDEQLGAQAKLLSESSS